MKRSNTITVDLKQPISDLAELLIVRDLTTVYECLVDDYARRKKGTGTAIFHTNKAKDLATTKKHIEAIKLVLKYYGKEV